MQFVAYLNWVNYGEPYGYYDKNNLLYQFMYSIYETEGQYFDYKGVLAYPINWVGTLEYSVDWMENGDPANVDEQTDDTCIAELVGEWEAVHLNDGNASIQTYAQVYSQTVYNCTRMTVNMNVEMYAGTSCKSWQIWGRRGGSFVKIGTISLPAGSGFTTETVTFATPVTFDAITITATMSGGYSYDVDFVLSDIYIG